MNHSPKLTKFCLVNQQYLMYSQRNNWPQQQQPPLPQSQTPAQQPQIPQYGPMSNVHPQYPRQNLPNKANENRANIYGQFYGLANYGQTNQHQMQSQEYLPANNVQQQSLAFNYYPNTGPPYSGGNNENNNWNNYPNTNIENINGTAMGSMSAENRFDTNYPPLGSINTNTPILQSRPQSSAMSCRSMSSLSTANMVINDMNSTMNTFVEENRFLKNIA